MAQWLWDIRDYLIGRLLPGAIVFLLGLWAIRLVLTLMDRLLRRSRVEAVAHRWVKRVLRATLWVLLMLITASRLGIDVTGIVALASVLTLAISLSVQTALTNLISGFMLLYTKPFAAGDYVEIAGQSGSVETVGLTYTTLVTPDNKSILLPNGAVTAAQIVNYTVMGKRRVTVSVAASYFTPVETVVEALQAAAAVPTALPAPPPFAAVESYGEHGVNYILHVWSAAENYWDTLYAVQNRVRGCFLERGIEMPYPHVYVEKRGSLTMKE